jgi:uncharacterized membrane protein affecting hemolysin expression
MLRHTAKCPFCGKVYRNSSTAFFAIAILALIVAAILIFSFNQGQQQTQAAQRELEEAAKAAGLH